MSRLLLFIGRMNVINFFNSLFGVYFHMRAWSYCTPAILYQRKRALEVAELYKDVFRNQPYDEVLWYYDLAKMQSEFCTGKMIQPNLIEHNDNSVSTKLFSIHSNALGHDWQ